MRITPASRRFFLLVLFCALWGWAISCSRQNEKPNTAEISADNAEKIYPLYVALERRERKVDETVWARELLAQRCGGAVERLWDSLNSTTNKLEVLGQFSFSEILLPELLAPTNFPHGIEVAKPSGRNRKLDTRAWQQWLQALRSSGWELVKVELRHTRFDPPPKLESEFYVCGELYNAGRAEAATVEGSLVVHWDKLPANEQPAAIHQIDATRVSVRSRRGESPFQLAFDQLIPTREKNPFIDPLILYDLDGDGRSEMILTARNLVLRMRDWKTEAAPLCTVDPDRTTASLIADFNNDGIADLLCAKADGLFLYPGSGKVTFDQPPQIAWQANPRINYALAMTCGDIDGDGDLDVWLTQYKVPYLLGQLPTPYHDANDGYPSFLLRNDGRGNFTDVTQESGLAPKRHRRTYSASFVDLDRDGDLDLVVVSDFSGLDLYRNDGRGRFTDVTRDWAGEPYAAGMAHALADFDRDGELDLLMMGMTSATVDRLEHLNLKRRDSKIDESKRAKLMAGNRLLVGRAGGGFAQTALGDSIARSGWSWGCGALDFDNDGFLDVYIATGHETKQTVRDYEGQYWLHDLYIGNSSNDAVNVTYFTGKAAATRGRGHSFGGWDRNRFFWNDHGKAFMEIGQLLGVSLQQDCRNVVADDLDGDGRVDLLVTTFEEWPVRQQTLKIFRNNTPDAGNWIGFRLREQGGGVSPVGAKVILQSNSSKTIRTIVTGDSYRSQHANTVHFGLGQDAKVERVEVQWPNGRKTEISEPSINRYHDVELR